MKKMFLGLIVLLSMHYVHAQDQASLKPLIKQIALLKTYIGYLEKGYAIAREGLNTISNIKNGHWTMDIGFFNSLKHVNPKIAGYAKIGMIAKDQTAILHYCARLKNQSLHSDEMLYIHSVIEFLLNDCATLADEVAAIITDGKLQLSDDERLQEIDRIYADMHSAYGFIRNFYEQARLLIRNRLKDENESKVSKKLNGL